MSELENDEVGKCRSWLMSGWQMSGWQASELDFDTFPSYSHQQLRHRGHLFVIVEPGKRPDRSFLLQSILSQRQPMDPSRCIPHKPLPKFNG